MVVSSVVVGLVVDRLSFFVGLMASLMKLTSNFTSVDRLMTNPSNTCRLQNSTQHHKDSNEQNRNLVRIETELE